jgi:hypothetical protein
MKFKSVVELGGKTATGIPVPEKVVEGLGSSKRPAVTVTINGYTYRSTIAPMGGKYYLPLSAANREGAKVAAGDKVEVAVELDTKPRKVELPADFKKALSKEPAARKFFEGLSYSKQRWFSLSVESAKKPDTRAKRIADALAMLREGKAPR